MSQWIYFFGEATGRDIKIGITNGATIRQRRKSVDSAQMNSDRYVLLAGVRGPKFAEARLGDYFSEYRRMDKGQRREYYEPADPLIEYILWLRQQWYVSHSEDVEGSVAAEGQLDTWLPRPDRREVRPTRHGVLFGEHDISGGPLAGTAWAWMPDLQPTFQDYFTPTEIVGRAADAMGGIDLDAASHYIANRRLHEAGVQIGEFFHINKSAFTHDWLDRVWLNPPYGENEAWFVRARAMIDAGLVRQLCMLSPVYAFTTAVAQPLVEHSAAGILLSPTPKFWNPADPSKTGTNHPHAIFYWGDRVDAFLASFSDIGIPFTLARTLEGAPA